MLITWDVIPRQSCNKIWCGMIANNIQGGANREETLEKGTPKEIDRVIKKKVIKGCRTTFNRAAVALRCPYRGHFFCLRLFNTQSLKMDSPSRECYFR
ncbi:hypothetical protein CEXT_752311 [Caerostris extrusa]|uniref:Uncharacterized protein n=1 Tax=Caerostris extrusa TaxID=172846 RepID=A0AAV4QL98_CAEEX|nr:hypothetical protein CEXT_752311 [Caerostris extrusa]